VQDNEKRVVSYGISAVSFQESGISCQLSGQPKADG